MTQNYRWVAIASGSLLLSALLTLGQPGFAKRDWTSTPLTPEMYSSVQRASRQMRSGKFDAATATVTGVLASATDVPKCLAIAAATEEYGFPMMDARRACLNRAFGLSSSNDDLILVALKSRQYQMFEITRQAVNSLLASAKSLPELYDLARKCQEVALNDVAHLAMEKAYTGVKDEKGFYVFTSECKALGMEDLLRKAMKDYLDGEDLTVTEICDALLKCESYKLRDQTRYGLRRALDKAAELSDMEAIFETARRLNEPDVANRANYYVRRAKVIEKIKTDRANYQAQLRAWREGIDIDTARQQAGLGPVGEVGGPGGASAVRRDPPTSGF